MAIALASGECWKCSIVSNIRAALAINGSAIQAYEPIARAALARAWEFIGHGFGQKNMQKVPDERADIAKNDGSHSGIHGATTARMAWAWLDRDHGIHPTSWPKKAMSNVLRLGSGRPTGLF